MKTQRKENSLLIRLDPGDEIIGSLKEICAKEGIKAGSLTGIGAANHVEIGSVDPKTGTYASRTFTGGLEIASLAGNISAKDGKPFPHVHIVIGDEDCNAFSGHLLEARISVTCEIILNIIEGEINRNQHWEL